MSYLNRFKVILHQFCVKKIFPWKFYLEYGGTFTKLFMHVSSQNMFTTTRNLQIHVHVLFRWLPIMTLWRTQDLNSFWEIIAHAQCSVDEKKNIYTCIQCVPHKNNCKKKIGSHDMKQTDSSIIIVRNVCLLTSESMIVYLFITRSGGTFTKLFMHVSSQNMFTTTRNLQIHVHVLFRWLPIMTLWRKVLVRWLPIMTLWRKDKQSWILR
jgi:hypothetical protein